MRCPKCGFNSFDHNLLCPKCRKDLTATRRLLNLTVPVPGVTDFFNTAGQRAAFPEPLLGEALPPDDQSGSMFPAAGVLAAGALAAAPPFGAPPPPAADLPFGAPPFPADATIADIMPLAADEGLGVDIRPLEADDDLDEITPIEIEEDLDEITPIEAEADLGEITPIEATTDSIQIFDPALGEEEIVIEIDDLVEPVEEAEAAAVTAEGHQMALDHIKNTLAKTGDLDAPVKVGLELEEAAKEPAISEAPVESLITDLIVGGDQSLLPDDNGSLDSSLMALGPIAGLEELDLDEPLIEDIEDSDILEPDDTEENSARPSDTVVIDLDPDDLAPDFFDEASPEPELEPIPEITLRLDEAPNLEELAPGDLAGPFWDEATPILDAPSAEIKVGGDINLFADDNRPPESSSAALGPIPGQVPSLEELDKAPAPDPADLNFDSMDDDQGLEPEDLDLSLETNLSGFDLELTAEEIFAAEIQPLAAPQETVLEPAAEPATEPVETPVHPLAMPEIPAGVFGAVAPEDTLSSPQMTPGGNLDADDLSCLADDINLDDLDSEL